MVESARDGQEQDAAFMRAMHHANGGDNDQRAAWLLDHADEIERRLTRLHGEKAAGAMSAQSPDGTLRGNILFSEDLYRNSDVHLPSRPHAQDQEQAK